MKTYSYALNQDQLLTFAKLIKDILRPGDILALWGDLGTGKTTFARILIQEFIGESIDVPSPTFTLVQIYDSAQGEIWHCDLYRIKNPEEVFELGLEDAFHHAICLIEWPERLGNLLPTRRIDMTFKILNETTREVTVNLRESYATLCNAFENANFTGI